VIALLPLAGFIVKAASNKLADDWPRHRARMDALYRPLNARRHQVRLLEIDSDTPTGTLTVCRLHVVSLKDAPKFTALSYLWGAPTETHPVIVNGHTCLVSENLSHALRHVRAIWQSHFPGRDIADFRLWADALCINQCDLPEKNVQVPYMKVIYPAAELVISWLGCGWDGIDLAFDTLRIIWRETDPKCGRKDASGRVKNRQPRKSWLERDVDMSWMQRYPHLCTVDSDDSNAAWQSLNTLLDLPYFRRVWVFQELVVGHSVVFCHGSNHLPSEAAFKAAIWLYRVQHSDLINFPTVVLPSFLAREVSRNFELGLVPFAALFRPWLVRETVFKEKKSTIEGLVLDTVKRLRASDPRDIVYGLLGLTACKIPVDYQKSTEQVYADFVHAAIEEAGGTSWLAQAGIGVWTDDQKSASWIPNFDKISNQIPFRTSCFTRGESSKGVFDATTAKPRLSDGKLTVEAVSGPYISLIEERSELFSVDESFYKFVLDFVQSRVASPPAKMHPLKAIMTLLWNSRHFDEMKNRSIDFRREESFSFLRIVVSRRKDDTNVETALNRIGLDSINILESVQQTFLDDKLNDIKETNNTDEESARNIFMYLDLKIDPRDESQSLNVELVDLQHCFRFVETNTGHVGLVPRGARLGDVICVVQGCRTPLLLRQVDGHHILLGSCHVLGMTDGQDILSLLESNSAKRETLEIW
jgi:Heterokaryon incompatibility protein (HET)